MPIQQITIFLLFIVAVSNAQYQQLYRFMQKKHLRAAFDKVAFSDDFAHAMLYGSGNNFAFDFLAYNWNKTSSTVRFTADPLTYLSFFTDNQGINNLIYATTKGQIWLRIFKQNSTDALLMQKDKELRNIKRVDVSSDKEAYSVLWENDTSVYIGYFNNSLDHQRLSFGYLVNNIRWRTESSQIAVSLSKSASQNGVSLVLYDYEAKIFLNMSQFSTYELTDMVFSSNGSILYFLSQRAKLLFYDFQSDKFTQIFMDNATKGQLIEIDIKGCFLTTYDKDYAYVWNILKTGKESYYGSYLSSISSPSLSPGGSILLTISSSYLFIYSLCSINRSQYFNSTLDSCQACSQECYTCFLIDNHCSSCVSSYFFANFTCLQCIKNCKICHNQQQCDTCLNGYYFNGQECIPCILGCAKCNNSIICLKCDSENHWSLDSNQTCICSPDFFEVNQTCEACLEGCQICNSTDVCIKCSDRQGWTESGTVCICKPDRYYEEYGDCQLCRIQMPGCTSCANDNYCLSCKQGYDLNTKTHKCDKEINAFFIVGICVSTVLTILGCIFRCLWKKWKENGKKKTQKKGKKKKRPSDKKMKKAQKKKDEIAISGQINATQHLLIQQNYQEQH